MSMVYDYEKAGTRPANVQEIAQKCQNYYAQYASSNANLRTVHCINFVNGWLQGRVDALSLNPFGTFNTMDGGFGSGNNIKINDFIMGIVSTGGAIIGGLAVLKIIFGGVMYATAAGNPQRISDAKSHILYALLGIALIAGANIILMLFGASQIQ